MPLRAKSVVEKAAELMDEAVPIAETGCLICMARLEPKGYVSTGAIGRQMRAHRLVYEAVFGPIPANRMVIHSCDVRSCINPAHLRLGTARDNSSDMVARKRNWKNIGTNHHLSRFTNQDVLEMRRLYESGEMRICQLAKRFNVGHPVVIRIINRQSWKHI